MSIQLKEGLQNETLDRVLEDLLVRFVLNAPPEDLSSNARVFFLFEEAHWFYLDYVRTINPSLPSLKMKAFSKKLIELFPLIWKGGDPDEGLKEFVSYKQSIPVRGAALFNSKLNKILLVQGVESSNWSFPRGKISKDEDDADCAVREVREEIGFDISPYINKDDYVERTIKAKNYRIYLCKDIPEDFEFKPLVRNEINDIKWTDFRNVTKTIRSNPQKYFLVTSMINPLQQWVKKHRGEVNENQLKLEVEAQLKSLLGIGTDNVEKPPTSDPGRELLDFIRQSAANKQLKDQKQLLSQVQQQQLVAPQLGQPPSQQHIQPYPPAQMFQPFPIPQQFPIIPGFGGFQPPPFQNLPFLTPFVPPPVSGLPPFANLPPMFNNGMIQQRPSQLNRPPIEFQNVPHPDQLSRPSFSSQHKNEAQSRELLSILNKKSNEKKTNAKELLNQFNTKKEEHDINIVDPSKKQATKSNGSEYSKGLLALLQKQPKVEEVKNTKGEAHPVSKQESSPSIASTTLLNLLKKPSTKSASTASSPSSSKDEKLASTPKQKLRILKREESLPVSQESTGPNTRSSDYQADSEPVSQKKTPKFTLMKKSQEPDSSVRDGPLSSKKDVIETRGSRSTSISDDEIDLHASKPPSKELLELIKQSNQNAQEAEIFEDFTDEEEFYESLESAEQEEEYEEQSQDDHVSEKSTKDNFEHNEVSDPEDYEIQDEYKNDMKELSATVPELGESMAELSVEEFLSVKTGAVPVATPPKKFTMLKRGQDLSALLKEQPKEETKEELPVNETVKEVDPINEIVKEVDEGVTEVADVAEEPAHESVEKIQDELEEQSGTSTIAFSDDDEEEEEESDKSISETADENHIEKTPDIVTEIPSPTPTPVLINNAQAKNDLLNLLHQKPSTPIKTLDEIESSNTSIAPSFKSGNNDLLNTLFQSSKPAESSTPGSRDDASASLLNLLHKKEPEVEVQSEEPKKSNPLLDLLKKKSTPTPPPSSTASIPAPTVIEQPTPTTDSNASNHLMGLLNIKPQQQHQHTQPEHQSLQQQQQQQQQFYLEQQQSQAPYIQQSPNQFMPPLHQQQVMQPPQQFYPPPPNQQQFQQFPQGHEGYPSQFQQQQQFHPQPPAQQQTPANDLLNLLHKQPQQPLQQLSNLQGSDESQTAKHKNNLLNLLLGKN